MYFSIPSFTFLVYPTAHHVDYPTNFDLVSSHPDLQQLSGVGNMCEEVGGEVEVEILDCVVKDKLLVRM